MNARVVIAMAMGSLLLPSAGFAQANPADGDRRSPIVVPEGYAVEVRSCAAPGGGDPMPGSANDPEWQRRHPGLAAVYAASCPEPRLVVAGRARSLPVMMGNGSDLPPEHLRTPVQEPTIEIRTEGPVGAPSRPE